MDTTQLARMALIQEESVNHMYLDSNGYVTVGVRKVLLSKSAAKELRFRHRQTGELASELEIEFAFEMIRNSPLGFEKSDYKNVTDLMLDEADIERVLLDDLSGYKQALATKFSEFGRFPVSAREALLAITFKLGLNGLINKMPELVVAVESLDWMACAAECNRDKSSPSWDGYLSELFINAALDKQLEVGEDNLCCKLG